MNNDELGRLVAGVIQKTKSMEKEFSGFQKRIDTKITQVCAKQDELNQLIYSRPPWIVTAVVSILFAACATLTTLLIAG